MAIRYETADKIPADEKNDFVEFKEGELVVFYHKDYAESKKTEFRLQGDVTKLNGETAGMKTKLDELSAAETARAAEAETLRQGGLTAAQRSQEVIDNLTKTVADNKAEYDAGIAAATSKTNDQTKSALVADIAANATEANRGILRRMAAADIEIQADGTTIILDENGRATPQTVDEYKANLKDRYPSLVSAVQSKGGNGQGGAGGTSERSNVGHSVPGFSQLPLN